MWTVIYQKLNTFDLIQRRNSNMCLSRDWCISCKTSNENLNHLFIQCSKAQKLWSKLQLEIGLVMNLSSAKDLCLSLRGIQCNNVKNTIKFNAAMATLWLSFENLWENIYNFISIWSSKNKLLKDYS